MGKAVSDLVTLNMGLENIKMATASKSRFSGAVSLLVTICLLSIPAYAKYSGGAGEPDDPYQIATAAELILLGNSPEDYDKHFILTADIDLNPYIRGRKVFDRAVIAPEIDKMGMDIYNSPSFRGVFDGNGHKISHLTISGESYLGLFGRISFGAQVFNLGLEAVDVYGNGSHVGGLVAYNEGDLINCYSTGAVGGKNYVGGLVGSNSDFFYDPYDLLNSLIQECFSTCTVIGNSGIGGFVGWNHGNVIACYSTGQVSGDSFIGGLVGINGVYPPDLGWQGTISDCYSTGQVSSTQGIVGGLVGSNTAGTVTRCYSTGSIDGSYDVGGLVGLNKDTENQDAVTQCFWDIQTSSLTISDGGSGKTTTEMQMAGTFFEAGWDFVDETENGTDDIWKIVDGVGYPCLSWQKFNGGTGEPNNPYLISTADQLRAIGDSILFDKYFMLIADIDLDPNIPGNEIFIDRPYIKFFGGTLDGNGHSISNMVIESYYTGRGGNSSHLGLIGHLSLYGTVKNIQLQNITILGVGHYVGALLGSNRGLVLRCSVTGSVCGESFIGGLVGSNYGDIVSCSAFCSVELVPGGPVGAAGGLLGYNSYGCIYNCYAIGTVTGTESVGGLIGENYSYISNCYAKGTVTGEESVGGLVGGNTGYVSNCYAIGTVTGNEFVGGLIGNNKHSHPTVSQCYAACEIIAGPNDSIGGLVGKSSGRSINSFWDIKVSGQDISAGGIGLPTAELQDTVTYLSAGWDLAGETSNGLADIWTIAEPNTYPQLTRLIDQYPITQLSGSGIPDDPYEIAMATDLVAINDYDINAHYVLVADIDMSGMVWATAPIFFFDGTLDGQGHTISNLTIQGGSYLGLFAKIITHGVVTNLTIQNADIIGHRFVGALAGESYGHITNCHVTGNITGENYVAGLVGLAKILYWTTLEEYISDCTSNVVLSGDDHVHDIANALFYD